MAAGSARDGVADDGKVHVDGFEWPRALFGALAVDRDLNVAHFVALLVKDIDNVDGRAAAETEQHELHGRHGIGTDLCAHGPSAAAIPSATQAAENARTPILI